jgi:hypothetical protein
LCGSLIADPDNTQQSLRASDDLTADKISIAEAHAIEDASGSIIRCLYKLYKYSGHPELSQKPLEGSTTSTFSRCSTPLLLTSTLSRCHRIWIEFFFQKLSQYNFHSISTSLRNCSGWNGKSEDQEKVEIHSVLADYNSQILIEIHLFRLFSRALTFHNCVIGRFPAYFKSQICLDPLLVLQRSVPLLIASWTCNR